MGISSWFVYNISGNRKWKQNSGFGKPADSTQKNHRNHADLITVLACSVINNGCEC